MKAALPFNEPDRLSALNDYCIMDTPPEAVFDAFTRLAAYICGTPIALVSLIDANRQWFKSRVGLDVRETPRDIAFCAHAILQTDTLIIPDTLADERFKDNPLVTTFPHIRFYAGVPLTSPDGHALGTLCVIDRIPRQLSAEQLAALRALGHEAMTHLELRRKNLELEPLRDRLELILNEAGEGIYGMDAQGNTSFVSLAAAHMLGWEAHALIGKPLHETIHHSYHDGVPYPKESCPIHTVLADHNTRRGQDEVFWRQDGTSFFVQYVCAPIMKTGKCVGVVVIFEDITERKYAYEAMRQSEAQLRLITDAVPALIAYVDTNQCFRFNNKAFEQWFGLAREQVYGRHLKEVLGELAYQAIHEHVEQALTGHRVNYEAPIPYQQGGTRDINASYIPDIDGQGEVKGYVALIHDITAHKQAEQRLAYLAHYDTLTGLPNRTLLNDRLSQAMARRSAAHQTQVAILFLDLDHFKTINDTAGHSIADALLREVGERLSACVRIGDTVARLGGDEFAIILIDLTHKIDVGQFVQKIPDCLSAPFKIDGHEIFVTASIGVSLYPDDGLNAETLLKNADTAMYLAKQRGRNCYQYYSAALGNKAATRVSLENSLRQALARDEFVLHYQPQVDLATSQITAVEALVRWNNPHTGLVLPSQFIPLTEDTGLIVALGEWVLHTACAQNKAWQRAGLPSIRIGVNLSARQFQQQNKRTIVNHILHILQETGLDPHYLELELTESVLQTIEVAGMLRTLRGTGIQIAIDDFGTGYSSLSYLKRFPLDKLKIDKSFMQGVPDDPDNVAITTAIIAMAHSLKLKVIAEGVETLAQLDFLRSLKCDEIQGFLFSCALPAPELEELLAAQSATL